MNRINYTWPMQPRKRRQFGHLTKGISVRMQENDGPPPKTCQWLHGDPRDRDFCGQPTTKHPDGRRSSYCEEHHARCWHKTA